MRPEGEQGESGLVGEGEEGVAEDLSRCIQRVDRPVGIVSCGPLEPLEPVGDPELGEEGEELTVFCKAVVVVLFNPVLIHPVGGETAAEMVFFFVDIHLVPGCEPQCSCQTGKSASNDAYLHGEDSRYSFEKRDKKGSGNLYGDYKAFVVIDVIRKFLNFRKQPSN